MKGESLALEYGSLAYLRGGKGPLVVFSHALGPLAWGALDRLMGSCTVAVPMWDRSTVPARTMGELGWFGALPNVRVPTLVLSGRYSSVMGPRYGRTAAALLPRGKHIVFEESSHALQLEEADEFQDALAAFVTGDAAVDGGRAT
jgi:pimeloyl-ACP methyl ester carboxylesterase